MNAGKPVVDVQNVSFSYGDRLVLEDVNLTVERGAFVGLVGPNGGGKSTLIKLILGLLKPDRGEIRLFGQPLERFRAWTKIGYVSQKANSFNSGFPATVFEVVAMGLFGKMGLFKWMGKREKEKVYQTLEWVGMAEYARQPIGKLSGGQQQRVFIARAWWPIRNSSSWMSRPSGSMSSRWPSSSPCSRRCAGSWASRCSWFPTISAPSRRWSIAWPA